MDTIDGTLPATPAPPGAAPLVATPSEQRLIDETRALAAEAGGQAAPSTLPAGNAPAVPAGSPFDQAATQEALEYIVETLDETLSSYVADEAKDRGATASEVERFRQLARCPAALKKPMVEGCVDFCREKNWSLSKKQLAVVCGLAWTRNIVAALKGARAVGPKPEPAPEPTPA